MGALGPCPDASELEQPAVALLSHLGSQSFIIQPGRLGWHDERITSGRKRHKKLERPLVA